MGQQPVTHTAELYWDIGSSDIVVCIVLLLLLTVFAVSARLVVGEIPLFSFVDCSLVRSFDFFPTILYLCYNQSQGTVVD